MDAADAAGGEDADAGHVGDEHGGGHCRGPVGLPGYQGGQIPAAGLGDLPAGLAQVFDLLPAEPGLQAAADDGDGGGDSPIVADGLLHQQGGLHILGVGHAVGDDGALQRHHGAALIQSLFDLGRYIKISIHKNLHFLVLKVYFMEDAGKSQERTFLPAPFFLHYIYLILLANC